MRLVGFVVVIVFFLSNSEIKMCTYLQTYIQRNAYEFVYMYIQRNRYEFNIVNTVLTVFLLPIML